MKRVQERTGTCDTFACIANTIFVHPPILPLNVPTACIAFASSDGLKDRPHVRAMWYNSDNIKQNNVRVSRTMHLLLPLVDERPVWPGVAHQPELQAVGQHPAVEEVPKLPVCCLQVGVFLAYDRLVDRQVCRDAEYCPHQDEERPHCQRNLHRDGS